MPEAVRQLGSMMVEYPESRSQRWFQYLIGGFLLIVSLAFFSFACMVMFDPAEGTLGERFMMILLPVSITLFCFPWSMFMFANARRQIGACVLVFEHGLAQVQGKSVCTLRWEELETVRESRGGLYMNAHHAVKTRHILATDRRGQSLTFTDALSRFGRLAGTIHTKIAEQKVPPARAALDAGQTLRFGPVTIDAHGLNAGGQLVRWTELETVDIASDNVVIRTKREIFKRPGSDVFEYGEIPNLNVLWVLAEDCKEKAAG